MFTAGCPCSTSSAKHVSNGQHRKHPRAVTHTFTPFSSSLTLASFTIATLHLTGSPPFTAFHGDVGEHLGTIAAVVAFGHYCCAAPQNIPRDERGQHLQASVLQGGIRQFRARRSRLCRVDQTRWKLPVLTCQEVCVGHHIRWHCRARAAPINVHADPPRAVIQAPQFCNCLRPFVPALRGRGRARARPSACIRTHL